jgi:antitoxin YefM
MIAANYTSVRNNLKEFCDLAVDHGETVIVTRKANRNVVLMSLDQYNALMKEVRNARYIEKIDRGFAAIAAGKGQIHELIEVDE